MSYTTRSQWIEDAKDRLLKNEGRADQAAKELLFLYDEAAYSVEKEINTLYARYAKENSLTAAEASRLLSGQEYSRWRKSIEEYITGTKEDADGSKVLLELNTLAMKSRISRKEQLLSSIYRAMIDLAGDSETKLTGLLEDLLEVNYYESCFTLQKGFGLGFHVAKLDTALIKQVVSFPWSEKHFSEAIWGASDHIAALAKREITLGFMQGSGVDKMARAIDEIMDKGRYNAQRLVRTECKYFSNQGELLGYKESGVKKYRFIGGTEGSTHCDCARLNGQIFRVEEAVDGVNIPPLHPNCLCFIVAAFEKSLFADRKDARPLDKNIKFQEWKKKYVR